MALDNLFAQGQSNPGARILPAGVQALEDGKDPFKILRFHTDTVIPYRK
jgi:hypothetical protein